MTTNSKEEKRGEAGDHKIGNLPKKVETTRRSARRRKKKSKKMESSTSSNPDTTHQEPIISSTTTQQQSKSKNSYEPNNLSQSSISSHTTKNTRSWFNRLSGEDKAIALSIDDEKLIGMLLGLGDVPARNIYGEFFRRHYFSRALVCHN